MNTKKEVFGAIRVYPFAYTSDFEFIAVVCPFCHGIHLHRSSGFQVPACKIYNGSNAYRYYIKPEDRPLPIIQEVERNHHEH